jgi:hypothetical protein
LERFKKRRGWNLGVDRRGNDWSSKRSRRSRGRAVELIRCDRKAAAGAVVGLDVARVDVVHSPVQRLRRDRRGRGRIGGYNRERGAVVLIRLDREAAAVAVARVDVRNCPVQRLRRDRRDRGRIGGHNRGTVVLIRLDREAAAVTAVGLDVARVGVRNCPVQRLRRSAGA